MWINMMSKADIVKGHGVLSAHDEQVELVKQVLGNEFTVCENERKICEITHYHSVNPEFCFHIRKYRKNGKTVGSVHFLPETVENSICLPGFAKKILYRYMISFYRKMDYLVTVNPCFVDALSHYGIPGQKITYIPNVVSEENFYPLSGKERIRIRKEYRIHPDAFVVLGVGQLQQRKGILDFIKTAEKMPECMFLWAGGFSFGKISKGYREIQKAMKHLPDNIRFLGMTDRGKMNEIYNLADVLFLPSYEELFPMTVLEAMNCGLPVLVRNLDIYEPILFDYVLRGNDAADFVEMLNLLKTDRIFYERSSYASYTGHLFYSRERVGNMWKEFYGKIAEKVETEQKQFAEIRGEVHVEGGIM